MEQEVDELFQEESRLRKQKEKIDNSPDIIAKRLNVFKNAEKEEEKKEKSNSDGMNDFVIVEKPEEKKENDGNKSDENDF